MVIGVAILSVAFFNFDSIVIRLDLPASVVSFLHRQLDTIFWTISKRLAFRRKMDTEAVRFGAL